MVKVGVVGATGYAGGELLNILAEHPGAEVTFIGSRGEAGNTLGEYLPAFYGHPLGELRFQPPVAENIVGVCDLVFTAVPHGKSMSIVPQLLQAGVKVIDLAADFRFRDPSIYEEWYGVKHTHPELCKQAVYGLPELYREEIKSASLIGNPGCYPTSVILGAVPAVKHHMVDVSSAVVSSLSGVSGAGRKLHTLYHFAERNESMCAYKVGEHRHTPEIEQELSRIAGKTVRVSFTPHLIPVTRGILSTIVFYSNGRLDEDQVHTSYRRFYSSTPFVDVLPRGILPETGSVYASNHCQIGVKVDVRLNRLIVVTVIDNLRKGAASQAVQNMNLMFGFEESAGISMAGIHP